MNRLTKIEIIKGGAGEFFRLRTLVDTFPESPAEDICGSYPILDELRKQLAEDDFINESLEVASMLSIIHLN